MNIKCGSGRNTRQAGRRLGSCHQRGRTVDSGKPREGVSKRKNESVTVRLLPTINQLVTRKSLRTLLRAKSVKLWQRRQMTLGRALRREQEVCEWKQSTNTLPRHL